MSFSPQAFRQNFPQLGQRVNDKALIYFDNAASTLKHAAAINRSHSYNSYEVSNVHRGAHTLSRQGTENYEAARKVVQRFIGAEHDSEIVFTRGTTESINLVASSLSGLLQTGDEIVLSPFEHHSNIVPWQILCEKRGCELKVLDYSNDIHKLSDILQKVISKKTRLVSFLHYSNSLGHRMPVEKMVEICRENQIMTLIDGAQALLSEKVDVKSLGCDFYCFSGHKLFAPYGIGVLYARQSILEKMPPYQSGGSMIDRVTFGKTTYADSPQKFEAGTPNVAGALAMASALNAIEKDGVQNYHKHVDQLRQRLLKGLRAIPICELYEFHADHFCGVVSFNMKGAHSSDVGTLLDKYGVAVRSGHHCCQPLMDLMGIAGTVRASLAPYNTQAEVDFFIETLKKIEEFF